jgi:hypothetical protein
MRFANQLVTERLEDERAYPAIVNIISITLNTFAADYPFVLSGVNTKINSQQLKNIRLRITDDEDNDIIFITPVLWSFNLTRLD